MLTPAEISRCTALVCAEEGGAPFGVAFALFEPIPEVNGRYWSYLVTSKQLLGRLRSEGGGDVWIRANAKHGAVSWFHSQLADWMVHEADPTVDAAVMPVNPTEWSDMRAWLTSATIDKRPERNDPLGPGQEVAFTTLLVNGSGGHRNLPLVHIGRIAALPDEPIDFDGTGPAEALLLEAAAAGPVGGAPVFVGLPEAGGEAVYLLGLLQPRTNDGAGILTVAPMYRVLEILHQPQLEATKREQVRRMLPGNPQIWLSEAH